MQPPVRPRKGMATVAEFSSAPGPQKKTPTAAWRADQKRIKKQYKADMKAYWNAMREWRAAEKAAKVQPN